MHFFESKEYQYNNYIEFVFYTMGSLYEDKKEYELMITSLMGCSITNPGIMLNLLKNTDSFLRTIDEKFLNLEYEKWYLCRIKDNKGNLELISLKDVSDFHDFYKIH